MLVGTDTITHMKKVKMIFKLRALYVFGACSLYTALFSLKIYNSTYIINEVVKDFNADIDKLPIDQRGDKFDNAAILKTFFMFDISIFLSGFFKHVIFFK